MCRSMRKILTSWKLPRKLCVKRYSSSNSLQYICKSPWIAEDKNRIGVHFVSESHFIFPQTITVPGLCSILKMYLAWGHFCHVCFFAFSSIFIKSETFREPYTDDSERVLMFWRKQWPQSKPSPRLHKPLPLREGILYLLNLLRLTLQLTQFLTLIIGKIFF